MNSSENDEMGFLRHRALIRAMGGVQFNESRGVRNMMQMMNVNEAIDQLAMADKVHWYRHVLKREDGHVLRRTFEFNVECQKWE